MPIQPYVEVDYQNLPSQDTPLSAENLNNTDDQVGLLTSLLRSMEVVLGGELLTGLQKLANNPEFNYIDFVTNVVAAYNRGRVMFSDADDTLSIHHSGGVIQQIGEEVYIYTTNTTGTTILNGELIGLDPNTSSITRYLADGNTSPIYFLGVATQDIPAGQKGRLTAFGRVRGLDTSGLQFRKDLFASPIVAGGITNTKPSAPNVVITVGLATNIDPVNGEIFVRPVYERQKFFGTFFRTTDVTLSAPDTATPIQFNTTGLANGVSIDPLNTSRVLITNSGYYSFNFSCQMASTNASVKNVKVWLARNGVAIENSTMRRALETGTAVTVQTRTNDILLNAGDYVEVYWASDNINVILDYVPADSVAPFAPATPAVALQVTQLHQ